MLLTKEFNQLIDYVNIAHISKQKFCVDYFKDITRRSCLVSNSALFSDGQVFLLSFVKENLVLYTIFFIDRKCKWFDGSSKNNDNKKYLEGFYINKRTCNKYTILSVCIKLFSFLRKCYLLFYCYNFFKTKNYCLNNMKINSYTVKVFLILKKDYIIWRIFFSFQIYGIFYF